MNAATDGVLCLDKPAGMSSFAAMKKARLTLGIRRAGHTGTLDPAATGLLVTALGQATRIIPFLETGRKRYRAEVRLGLATDTQDAEGRVIEQKPVPPLSPETIEATLTAFRGEIEQLPPMYSALHRAGRRLYELARRGLEVERPRRRVRIERLDLLAWDGDRLSLDIVCGPGTYVRTLAADLAVALGTVGHLSALRRLETCGFDLSRAVPPNAGRDQLRQALLPLEEVLSRFPRVDLALQDSRRLVAGGLVEPPPLKVAAGSLVCVPAPGGQVLARLVEVRGQRRLKPARVLVPGGQ